MLPTDNNMLLSFINLKLRDYYDSLDSLCDDLDIDIDEIKSRLDSIDYTYNSQTNQFVSK